MKAKQQRNVQQHYVPASYLAGFTPDSKRDSQLYVYERKTDNMFRAVPRLFPFLYNPIQFPIRSGTKAHQLQANIARTSTLVYRSLLKP
jgi:hypothetical protein